MDREFLTTTHTIKYDCNLANRLTFGSGTLADAWDYVYDDRDQLTQVLEGLTVVEDYDYDANGNRDAVDGVAWQTTANNQLYRDGIYEYEYDDEGNRTKRIVLVSGQPTGATEEYTWDHRNRLTAVTFKTSPTGSITATVIYAYDVFDRKVRRDEDNNGDGIVDTREYFLHDGDDVLLDFYDADANGVLGQTIIARYLHGPGVDQILAQENIGANETYWHLGDHLQTTRDIVRYDEATSQTVAVEHLDYDAFGNVVTASAITRYLYTAREYDVSTGLQYNRARWYDSGTGRWISEDPIAFAAGDANLNRYVGNSPTGYVDPQGLSKVRIIIKIGDTVAKVMDVSKETALNLLQKRTKDAQLPIADRKYGGRVFAQCDDKKSAEKLAEAVSPEGEAVWHGANEAGHPGHYHPVKEYSARGRPRTEGTPHIGSEYTGNPSVLIGIGALEELMLNGADISIDMTPIIGDLRDAPALLSALGETVSIYCREGSRYLEIRNQRLENNIDRISKGNGLPKKGGTTTANWRDYLD